MFLIRACVFNSKTEKIVVLPPIVPVLANLLQLSDRHKSCSQQYKHYCRCFQKISTYTLCNLLLRSQKLSGGRSLKTDEKIYFRQFDKTCKEKSSFWSTNSYTFIKNKTFYFDINFAIESNLKTFFCYHAISNAPVFNLLLLHNEWFLNRTEQHFLLSINQTR